MTENETDLNINSVNGAYCKVCKTALRSHISDLKKHATSKHHLQKMKLLVAPVNQQVLPFTINITNEEKENDIKLSVFIAVHCSIRSVDHLGEILNVTGQRLKTGITETP